MNDALDVSVDDRRALWALTARHLRSAAHPVVLVVRQAIRRGARHIEVRTRGDSVVVTDDGNDLDRGIVTLIDALQDPHAGRLHALEREHGTDLLVAVATATSATLHARSGQRLTTSHGVVTAAAVGAPASGNVVVLHRSRKLRALELQELRAWLPSPRAIVVVDGKRLGTATTLPATTVLPQSLQFAGGLLQIGFALDDTVTRLTILARGVWVAQEHLRARGLPLVASWDDDTLPVHPLDVVAVGREVVAAVGDAALRTLAARFHDQPTTIRRRVRSLLLRAPRLPAAFFDIPLFDDATGPFAVSFSSLQRRKKLVIGTADGDVIVDDDARAFLQRLLPHSVVNALPRPRRRLGFMLRELLVR